MSSVAKKLIIKCAGPPSKLTGDSIQRKRRMMSQKTIDTTALERQQKIECQNRFNEEQLIRQINQSLKVIDGCRNDCKFKPKPMSLCQELKEKQQILQRKNKEILMLNQQIDRLKQIYQRPKRITPANQYSQQHLKPFTLTEELQKQRKHLELHIDHHAKLKQKADQLHQTIKNILPRYNELQLKRKLKPISYDQFRKRSYMHKQQQIIKDRRRSISERSSSSGRKSVSIKQIVQGKTSNILLPLPPDVNMWQMQRRKSIVNRSLAAIKKKHQSQVNTLSDQLNFLREQDGSLSLAMQELSLKVMTLQNDISQIAFKNASTKSKNSVAPST